MTYPTAQFATVYHSGRRRYLTLEAACRDAARQRVFKAVHEMGEDLSSSDDWWRPRVDRLARQNLGELVAAEIAARRQAVAA